MQNNSLMIGSLRLDQPVLLAPMAGITSLPYRRIMKSFGAGLVFTEMVSANGLIRDGRRTRELLRSHPDEFPLGIQLFGDGPEVLAEAVRMIADESRLIDINMGCPVKKVIRSGAGSALLQDPERVERILVAVRKAYSGPLTIKIRSGWDEGSVNFLQIGKIAENAGVDAMTLHPRTRARMFGGQADWKQIRELSQNVNIPVFGSGDIFTPEDGVRMLAETGCNAVMIGRGAYGNPWLIERILLRLAGEPDREPTAGEKYQIARRHLELHREQFGDSKTLLEMRKHLCWYARGLSGSSHFRAALQKARNLEQAMILSEDFFYRIEAA